MALGPMVWAIRQPIEPTRRIVLIALADEVNGDGYGYPGQKRIAATTHLSERTVLRALADLEEHGYIRRQRRYRRKPDGSTGYRTSDHVWLNVGGVDPERWVVHLPDEESAAIASGDSLSGEIPDLPDSGGDSYLTTVSPVEELRSSDPSSKTQRAKRAKGAPNDTDFQSFWDAYGLKLDLDAARRAWRRARASTDSAVVIDGARRYVAWLAAQDDPPKQKYPATWLNGQCWTNEYVITSRRDAAPTRRKEIV